VADLLVLNPADTVAILTERGVAPAGHKIARAAIARGAAVVKYGQIIGYATCDIAAGDHVHSHNLAFGDHDRDQTPGAQATPRAGRRTDKARTASTAAPDLRHRSVPFRIHDRGLRRSYRDTHRPP
jgi:hypothetical protein